MLMNDLDDLPVDLSPGPAFSLPKETPREQVALRLTEKASQSVRKRKRDSTTRAESTLRGLLSPSPKRPTTPALSPAAQRLVAQKLNATTSTSSNPHLADRQLRASYSSPSPSVHRHRASTPSTPAAAASPFAASKAGLAARSTPSKPSPSPLLSRSSAAAAAAAAAAGATPTTAAPKSLTDDLLNI
jgi:hypothetical protein